MLMKYLELVFTGVTLGYAMCEHLLFLFQSVHPMVRTLNGFGEDE